MNAPDELSNGLSVYVNIAPTPLRATSISITISPDVFAVDVFAHASNGPPILHAGCKVPWANTPCISPKNKINGSKNFELFLNFSNKQQKMFPFCICSQFVVEIFMIVFLIY